MKKILASWIGDADLNGQKFNNPERPGPIVTALKWGCFDGVELLSNRDCESYRAWLENLYPKISVIIHAANIANPNDLEGIYKAADQLISNVLDKYKQGVELTYQLSAGTPVMAGAWMLLANASANRRATLIESSTGTVNKVAIPFGITATYLRGIDESIKTINSSVAATFKDIFYKSDVMSKAVAEAALIAQHNIPVLLYGESGTGKELFASAIRDASSRADKPYIPVNCGAIPENLIESELFGHKKGSFTGADQDHIGVFKASDGGTIFLDEIGDLPLSAQVKILRAIDTQRIKRVGDTAETKIDVRIIAATHRNLQKAVREGKFRLDLFYRLAVGFLEIPPLRDRHGDVEWLVNKFINKADQKLNISVKAMKELCTYNWPGNVRELKNTISRCCYKSSGDIIQEDVVRDALIQLDAPAMEDILGREFSDGFDIDKIKDEVVRHYYAKAMEKTGGNQASAAKLLGLQPAAFRKQRREKPHLLTG